MSRVVHRVFLKGDKSRDDPSTFEAAEAIAGRRLDRRKNYAIIQGEVRQLATWTSTCSGCEGSGCSECGYTGRRRGGMWVPLDAPR